MARASEKTLRLFDIDDIGGNLPTHLERRIPLPPEEGPLRLLACGSRTWRDFALITVILDGFHSRHWYQNRQPMTLIEGAQKSIDRQTGERYGADYLAGEWARMRGFELGKDLLEFPADWDTFGKGAGFIRNAQMLTEAQPNLVVAFSDHLGSSKGTADMIQRAAHEKVPVIHIRMIWS